MVYIVLINFMNSYDTVECIESISKLNYTDFKIVIVDNSIIPQPISILKHWLTTNKINHSSYKVDNVENFESKVTLIKANKNLGFAAANNIAIKKLLFEKNWNYVWLLNNDTLVDEDALTELVKHSEKSDSFGIIGSKLIDYPNSSKIQGISGLYNPIFSTTKYFGKGYPTDTFFDKIPIDYIPGASMFVRRKFIEEVGEMSEDYFLYFEELDWAIRAKKFGWKQSVCQNSKVFHKGGQSICGKEKVSILSDFYGLRNRLLFTQKYYKQYILVLFISFPLIILKRCFKLEFKKSKNALLILLHFFSSTKHISNLHLK